MKILPVKLAEAKEKLSTFMIELYVFRLLTGSLYIAACDEDIQWYIPGTTTPVTYSAIPIEREDINTSVDGTIDSTSIKVFNVDDAFTIALFSGLDFTNKIVDIITVTYPESLEDSDAFTHDFRGYMDAPELDRAQGTFTVNLKSPMPDGIPGRTFMLSCNAEFGDPEECGANLDAQWGTVGAGSTVHRIYLAQSKDDGYWKDGEIAIGNESRNIEDSIGNIVYLRYPFYYAPTGNYYVTRGCDKTVPSCKLRNNLRNNSGFPGIPFELTIKS